MNSPGEELLDFMVANAIYPFCSKKGKIFLRCSKKGILTEGKKKEIIEQLNIETGDECETLREEIKKQVAERRTTRPIKEWIKEERPREMLARLGAENLPLSKLLAIILRTGKMARALKSWARPYLTILGH